MVARFNRLFLGERENRGPIGAECWLECSEKQGQDGMGVTSGEMLHLQV